MSENNLADLQGEEKVSEEVNDVKTEVIEPTKSKQKTVEQDPELIKQLFNEIKGVNVEGEQPLNKYAILELDLKYFCKQAITEMIENTPDKPI